MCRQVDSVQVNTAKVVVVFEERKDNLKGAQYSLVHLVHFQMFNRSIASKSTEDI